MKAKLKAAKPKSEQSLTEYVVEMVAVADLKPHPDNYKKHPEDQITHLVASLKQYGVYKNLLVANDLTILAGHGITEACKRLGITHIPVKKFPFGPTTILAKKLLPLDNESSHLSEIDDRKLSELLKEIKIHDDLSGTGYDEQMLANLVMVTRHSSEINDINEAAEWVGMPAFENVEKPFKLVISFETVAIRNKLLDILNIGGFSKASGPTLSMWWPQKQKQDLKSVAFKKVKSKTKK